MSIRYKTGKLLLSVFIVAVVALTGCGTVKRATDGGSSSSNVPPTMPAFDNCSWTPLAATNINNIYNRLSLNLIGGLPYVIYEDWTQAYIPCIIHFDGSVWSTSVVTSNSVVSSVSSMDGYTIVGEYIGSYTEDLVLRSNGIELARINGDYRTYFDNYSLQVVDGAVYIIYRNVDLNGTFSPKTIVKKYTDAGLVNVGDLEALIPNGMSQSLKVISDTEMYLAYIDIQDTYALKVLKWTIKK